MASTNVVSASFIKSFHSLRMKLLETSNPHIDDILKIFHYARFDIAVLNNWIGELAGPVLCTKIASKMSIKELAKFRNKTLEHLYKLGEY